MSFPHLELAFPLPQLNPQFVFKEYECLIMLCFGLHKYLYSKGSLLTSTNYIQGSKVLPRF